MKDLALNQSTPAQWAMRLGVTVGLVLLLLTILLYGLRPVAPAYADLTSNRSGSSEGWRVLADMPTGRDKPGVVVLNGKVHVVGGWSGGPLATHEVYDPQSDLWQWSLPNLPIPRSDLMLAAAEGKLYAIGGYNPSLGGAVGFNHVYDPVVNTWTAATSMITPVSGAGVAVVNNIIYVVGGWDNTNEIRAVQSYDPTSDSWELKAPMPTARSELGAVALNGLIYAVGGNDINALATDAVEVYNPTSNTWVSVTPLPARRTDLAVTARQGKIYAIGGTDDWYGNTTTDTVFVYDPGTNSWSTASPMPTSRRGCEAGVVNDNIIYVVGGSGEAGAGTANEGFGFKFLLLPIVLRNP